MKGSGFLPRRTTHPAEESTPEAIEALESQDEIVGEEEIQKASKRSIA